jgi:hypothetical protein
MATRRVFERPWSGFLTVLLCCAGGAGLSAACGFSDTPAAGAGGQSSTTATNGGNGNPTNTNGGSGNPTAGNGNPTAGNGNPGGGADPGTGGAGTQGGGSPGGGANPGGGTGSGDGRATNYEYTGTWPNAPIKNPKPAMGKLMYTKKVIHPTFLAESCSIADYNGDNMPDVSSGRIWYEGPDFTKQHIFRDGHGVLPAVGAPRDELNTGVSDDWADYPFDVNKDGAMDIINIAQCDVPEDQAPPVGTPNKQGVVQKRATAVWYENPKDKTAVASPDSRWVAHLMHADVRNEQHGFIDMNGDGFPEIYGACKGCTPNQTKGYYQGNPAAPNDQWVYHPVSGFFEFPFTGLGWMHGEGGGDVNGDNRPDLMDRQGIWLQLPNGMWSTTACTDYKPGRPAEMNMPAGCGFVAQPLWDGNTAQNRGGSHMYATDMDLDGVPDIVSADWAHGETLAWYKQGADGKFTKYKFMGNAQEKATYGAYFTEPHSLQVADMDGDGRPDVITGKMRFAHPLAENDPDPNGVPYIYVFKNVAAAGPGGSPITLQPVLVDGAEGKTAGTPDAGMGVGRQLAVGYINGDAIMDICVGTKVGLAVFYGQ